MPNKLFQRHLGLCVWFLSGQLESSATFPFRRLQEARAGVPLSTVRIMATTGYPMPAPCWSLLKAPWAFS